MSELATNPRTGAGNVPAKLYRYIRAEGQRYVLLAVWAVEVVLFSILTPSNFLTAPNWANIIGYQNPSILLTLGLLFPLTAGDFDLSVAATMGFCSMLIAQLNVNMHVPIGAALMVGLLVGVAVGMVNALLAVNVGINGLIVTLGTGTVLNGFSLAITGGETIGGVSNSFVNLMMNSILGLPLLFYLTIGVAVALWYFLDMTPTGRRLLFVGHSATVAALSGIRVKRLRWSSFSIAGGMAALAAMANVGTVGAADPTSSNLYLLPAFAAAFLGATSISPGRFNIWGTVITTFFLVTGFTGLTLLGIANWIQYVFYGGVLVLAVVFERVFTKNAVGAEGTSI